MGLRSQGGVPVTQGSRLKKKFCTFFHLLKVSKIIFDLFKVSKMTIFNYDLFKGSKMAFFYCDLFKGSKVTILIVTCSESAI